MIQIRPRWPILAAAAAAITYGANHYRLAGLENLRLEVRDTNVARSADNSQAVFPESPFPESHSWSGFPQMPGQAPGRQPPQITPGPQDWQQRLTVGEKLAMWKGGSKDFRLRPVDSEATLPSTQNKNVLPTSTPIPIPPDFSGINQSSGIDPSAGVLPNSNPFSESDGLNLPNDVTRNNVVLDGLPGLASASNLAFQTDTASSVDKIVGSQPTIRIASFNACALNGEKIEHPVVSGTIVELLRQFDLVAIQEVKSSRDDILPTLIRRLNAAGRSYDYLIGPRVGRLAPQQQFAFVFDTQRLETDRYQLYSVDDPQDLLNFEPLVAWFRCKGVPKAKAFTFSCINLQFDENFYEAEIRLLPSLVDGIQNDGRNEDDWILAGDFAGPIPLYENLDEARAMRRVLIEEATTVEGTQQLDNLLFSGRATVEFSGRGGVFDFLRQHNMSLEEALQVSDRLPVWAEFSTVEGAQPGLLVTTGPSSG